MKSLKDKSKRSLLEGDTSNILGTLADTTWRMFLPAVVFIGFGLWADLSFGTRPFLILLGLIVGILISTLLVRKQIKKNKGSKNK